MNGNDNRIAQAARWKSGRAAFKAWQDEQELIRQAREARRNAPITESVAKAFDSKPRDRWVTPDRNRYKQTPPTSKLRSLWNRAKAAVGF